MELIERYLYEIKRHLSYKNRDDIIKELRSALTDELDNQYGPNPTPEQAAEVLKEFGSPQVVAARYHPEGQYLIGPALYPLFQMVAGIAISAVIGAQIIAWLVASFFGEKPASALSTASNLYNGALIALGWVVIVFMILQRFDVRPGEKDKPWDPASLPPVAEKEDVKRVERVIGIIVTVIILSILSWSQGKIGMYTKPGGTFYEDPVIAQYFIWICASILVTIGLDVYLLWQGRWTKVSRWVQVGLNLLKIVVLALLISGHQAWLQSHGVSGFQSGLDIITSDIENNGQIMLMIGFWFGLIVGLIVTVVESVVMVVKLVRNALL